MKKNDIVNLILTLKSAYPEATCSLNFSTPFELAIAVMLSAQCTDERVNKVTASLFKKYNSPDGFTKIDILELENYIRPCGFQKTKAKNIKALAKAILFDFDGAVPTNISDLVKLPGIGRKSANVIMLEAFNDPQGIAIDTHAKRVSNRLGLSSNTSPLKIEKDLLKCIPKKYYSDINHLFMWHGRYTCKAISPKCDLCPVQNYCIYTK